MRTKKRNAFQIKLNRWSRKCSVQQRQGKRSWEITVKEELSLKRKKAYPLKTQFLTNSDESIWVQWKQRYLVEKTKSTVRRHLNPVTRPSWWDQKLFLRIIICLSYLESYIVVFSQKRLPIFKKSQCQRNQRCD